jgi:hypothetical protein
MSTKPETDGVRVKDIVARILELEGGIEFQGHLHKLAP